MTNQATVPARNGSQKQPRKQIRGKLKAALDAMVWHGQPWDEAARNAKLTTRAMRKALDKVHVQQFIRHEREVFRATMSGRTLVRLAELRDQDENRNAAVKACQVLEQLGESESARGAMNAPRLPGMVVNIITGAMPAPVQGRPIEHRVVPLPQPIDAKPRPHEQVAYRVPYRAPDNMAAAPRVPWLDDPQQRE
jgi:hypothetical protein